MNFTGVIEKETSSLSLTDATKMYEHEYLPSRNYAQRTRVEYLSDLHQLLGFLLNSGVEKTGQVD
jgi:hypothetical protein